MMRVAVLALLFAVATAQHYYDNQARAVPDSDIYNEKTRFVVSPNFPYDYNGYPFNKAHAAVYQGVPAVSSYQGPVQASYQSQPYPSYESHQHPAPAPSYDNQAYKQPEQEVYDQKIKGMQYHGIFKDSCVDDGLYYRDLNSFVICSNNNPSVQACAPGSRNPEQGSFKYGDFYNKSDFCAVNLVDLGYAAAASIKG